MYNYSLLCVVIFYFNFNDYLISECASCDVLNNNFRNFEQIFVKIVLDQICNSYFEKCLL